MPEVNTNNSILNEFSIASKNQEKTKENELGQSAFLELMVTQLKNQDPLSPQDNSEFVAQLAQFSSVESLDKLNNNFDSFTSNFVANQALQASTLVGRSVTVPSDTARLEAGEVVSGSIDVPASSGNININIYGQNGSLIDQVSAGVQPAGEMAIRWDGLNFEVNGDLLDWQSSQENGALPGVYSFEVTAAVDDEEVELDTALSANVNSVTVGSSGGLILNLDSVGAVSLADVRQFNE